jgi:hypothetical protein
MPFKVRLKDATKESLMKRINEKLNAGYSLHTPPTPVQTAHKLYSYKSTYGRKRSVSAGDRIVTSYYAVVVK